MAIITQTLRTRFETKSWRQAGDAYGFADIDVWYSYTGFDNVVGRSEGDRNSALLLLNPFSFSGRSNKIDLEFQALYLRPDSQVTTFRWSLCRSRINEALYKNAGAQADPYLVATGTFTVASTGGSYAAQTITLPTTAVPSDTPLYLYLSRESDTLGNFHFRGNVNVTLTTGASERETPNIDFTGEYRIGSPLQIIVSGAQSDWITTVNYSLPPSYTETQVIGQVVGNGTLNWTPVKSMANSIQPGDRSLNVHIGVSSVYNGVAHTALSSVVLQPPNDLAATISVTANNSGSGIPSSALFVKDVSRFSVSLNVSNLYSASFARADIVTDSGNFSLNSASGNSPEAIRVSGSVRVIATIYDTWDRSYTVSTYISVEPYSPPTISNVVGYKYSSDPTVKDPAGTHARIKVSAACTVISNLNTVTLRYRLKTTGAAAWGPWETISSGTTSADTWRDISGLVSEEGYQIEINAYDTVGRETTVSLYAPAAEIIPFQILPTSIGIGKMTDGTFVVDINPAWEINYRGHPILEVVYPVGSIYMSVNSANPATLFGGTWERIQDMFLLAAGATHSAGSTGGSETVTLTADQMPVHSHDIGTAMRWPLMEQGFGYEGWAEREYAANVGQIYNTGTTGGGHAHNNMPPYVAVYVWKRTA